MKLRRLAIERLPGIDRPFELEELGDGLNIILGPNGAGKSRLCAATQALLWREQAIRDGGLAASALFDHDGSQWRVECDGSHHGWQREGVDSAPPPLPAEHLHGCFFLGLRDLLDDSDGAGRDLAGEIRRQMSGGFDLEAVRRRFAGSVSKQLGRKETKAVGSAQNAIRRAEQEQAGIARQEQTLDGLKADAAAAASAQRRLAHYDTALALKASLAAHSQCESDLAEFPKAIAQLDGKELERLESLDGQLAQKRSDLEKADKALTEWTRAAAASRLDEPIDGASLAAWRARADELAEWDRDLNDALLDVRETRVALATRQRALGSPADGGAAVGSEGSDQADFAPLVSLADDADLYAFLRASQQLASERDSLTTRLAQLASHEFSEQDARRRDRLERACESLRDWLRAPDPELQAAAGALWPPRAYLAIAGAAAIVSGLALYFAFHFTAAGIAVAASGMGLLLAALLTRIQAETSSTPDWRVIAQQRFPMDETAQPAGWTREAVGESLHQLEHDHAELVARARQREIREVEREQLAVALQRLEGPLAELESKRHELAERLGLEALRPDAELVDLARALDELRSAHADAERAAARCDVLKEATTQRLADIVAFLSGLAEDEPVDAAAARAGIHSLEERDRSLRTARDNAKRESETRERLAGEIAQFAREHAQIFQRAGLEAGDRVALTRLLDQLGRYRELIRAREDHASAMRHAKTALEAAGEEALARVDAVKLAEEKAAQTEDAARIQELSHKIGEITALARAAREGHDLEDAIASRSAAVAALQDRRDEALAAEAGKFLIDGIREEHESNQMPKVLERARHHFATFTHHRYELTVSPSNDASFVAVDAKSRLGLSPEKLSDGTRGQLILAARLAFAEQAEQGAALPLFLDEALEHSDPVRFRAIARSLARMVAGDGRQIFYLSNDPMDVERFRAAFDEEDCQELERIDLAAIRGQAASVAGPAALRVAPLAPVPNPAGQTPESYGLAIGVASLEPGGAIHGHSLYYLLRDALPLLYEFLEARIETVGQCQNVLRQGGPLVKKARADGSAGTELEDRIALFETFCLAWREGRGSKLGRLALEESGIISDTYLHRVTEFVTETGADGRRLIDAMRERSDPRFKGFRAAAVDDLERWLMENGHIDESPMLNEDEIVARALDTPAASRIPRTTATQLLHEWWSLSERAAAAG